MAELITKYRLEPSLRDVYVEGSWDAQVVRRFLARCTSRAVVYEIDSVEIAPDELLKVDLEDGRRGRVVFLALSIVESGLEPTPSITCLCDADREAAIGTIWNLWPLLMTDGTSLEMYLWSVAVVEKFLTFACKKPPLTAQQLMDGLDDALADVSLIQAARHLTGLGLERRSANRYLLRRSKSNLHILDREAFIREILGEGDQAWLRARLDECLTTLASLWHGESIAVIHADDAIDALLNFAAGCAATAQMRNRDVLERVLRASLESGDLDTADTFVRLRERICDN